WEQIRRAACAALAVVGSFPLWARQCERCIFAAARLAAGIGRDGTDAAVVRVSRCEMGVLGAFGATSGSAGAGAALAGGMGPVCGGLRRFRLCGQYRGAARLVGPLRHVLRADR